jgi:ER-bound oxygenase mpaB/B'/Rubber oxygenase, catalytic domain
MQFFVKENSVVRQIWGQSDTVLFIFAGASAEFALNKAVDWLYFTGKLPADPLGRLFSTVGYAKKIVFAPEDEAIKAISRMRQIHGSVEQNRGANIPDWAYRDVLYMLIFYSIASFELLERKLTAEEKEEVYTVFYRLGAGMGLKGLPPTYKAWLPDREAHLKSDLQKSHYTDDLFRQYKKHLGIFRYKLLIEAQKLLLPVTVMERLHFNLIHWLAPAVPLYKFSRRIRLDGLVKNVLLPGKYKQEIGGLDVGRR